MSKDPIVIVSAARTPMGGFQGDFASLACAQLGAAAIRAAVARAGLKPEQVEEVIMGCVLPAGQGQAPARQAALGAGMPKSTGCTIRRLLVEQLDVGGVLALVRQKVRIHPLVQCANAMLRSGIPVA